MEPFETQEPWQIPGLGEAGRHVVRQTLRARIDLDAISQRDGDSGRRRFAVGPRELAIRLPGREGLSQLQVQTVYELVPGVTTLAGIVRDEGASLFVLSVEDDWIEGKIYAGVDTFLLRGDAGRGEVALIHLDRRQLPQGEEPEAEAHAQAGEKRGGRSVKDLPPSLKSGSGSSNVSVLFLIAQNVTYRIPQMVSNILAEFNQSLIASDVSGSHAITSAGIEVLDDNLDGQCRNDVIFDMQDAQAPFDTLLSRMANAGADVALLILTAEPAEDPVTGLPTPYAACHPIHGRFGGVGGDIYNSDYPFALSTDSYATSDLTAVHELGHLMGGNHEWQSGQPVADGTDEDARGWNGGGSGPGEAWMTIMGGYYPGQGGNCKFWGWNNAYNCQRLARWSNPNQSAVLPGSTTPQWLGDVDLADMASHIGDYMQVVDDWHANLVPPAAPDPLTVTSHQCYGGNDAEWTAQLGAAHYELYKSTSVGFASPSLIYSGAATSALLDVPQGETWYLRAKACNDSGCSAYTNQFAAHHTNGCL